MRNEELILARVIAHTITVYFDRRVSQKRRNASEASVFHFERGYHSRFYLSRGADRQKGQIGAPFMPHFMEYAFRFRSPRN